MKISSKIHRQEWKQEYLWEKKSENPFESEFSDEEMEHGDIEWDFAAADEYGRTIVGWD